MIVNIMFLKRGNTSTEYCRGRKAILLLLVHPWKWELKYTYTDIWKCLIGISQKLIKYCFAHITCFANRARFKSAPLRR